MTSQDVTRTSATWRSVSLQDNDGQLRRRGSLRRPGEGRGCRSPLEEEAVSWRAEPKDGGVPNNVHGSPAVGPGPRTAGTAANDRRPEPADA